MGGMVWGKGEIAMLKQNGHAAEADRVEGAELYEPAGTEPVAGDMIVSSFSPERFICMGPAIRDSRLNAWFAPDTGTSGAFLHDSGKGWRVAKRNA